MIIFKCVVFLLLEGIFTHGIWQMQVVTGRPRLVIYIRGFHYMTLPKSHVLAELVYACSFLQVCSQRNNLKTSYFHVYGTFYSVAFILFSRIETVEVINACHMMPTYYKVSERNLIRIMCTE